MDRSRRVGRLICQKAGKQQRVDVGRVEQMLGGKDGWLLGGRLRGCGAWHLTLSGEIPLILGALLLLLGE